MKIILRRHGEVSIICSYVAVLTIMYVILEAALVYFRTLQRRSKSINSGKLEDSQKKQRQTQRKHNVSDYVIARQ